MLADEPFWRDVASFDASRLDSDPAIVVGVDDRLNIRLLNGGWYEAARRYGAEGDLRRWTLGRSLLEAISESERDLYRELFTGALRSTDPASWEYDCDDEANRRRFRLVAYPFEERALLVVHSLVFETDPTSEPVEVLRRRYVQDHGLVVKCAYCGRFRSNEEASWEWAKGVAEPEEAAVTHAICLPCATFHFGD